MKGKTPEQSNGEIDWLPSLDGWRAVAILLVLLSHSWASTNPPHVPGGLAILFAQGDFGVRVFLVVSGLLITLLLQREHRRYGDISLRNFYIRRVLRIFPVYFLFIGFLAFLQGCSLYHDAISTWIGSLTFTRNVVGQGKSATGHLWSLAVEEQFYLVWPLALVTLGLCRRKKLAIKLLLFVTMAACCFRLIELQSDGFIAKRLLGEKSALKYMDSLAIGCIGAFLLDRCRTRWPTSNSTSWLLRLALPVLVVSTMVEPSDGLHKSLLITLQSCLVLLCVLLSIFLNKSLVFIVLNSKPFIFIGSISYSLYIWHMVFLSHFIGENISGTILHEGWLWWIPSIAVATLSYFGFERPILKLKKRLQVPRSDVR